MYVKLFSAALLGAWITFSVGQPAAEAADLPSTNLKVSGGNRTSQLFRHVYGPFWSKDLMEMTGGAITADFASIDELGLKGPEILRLLKLGVFDISHGTISYMAGEDARFEGLDLSGLTLDIETQRAISDAYKPVLSNRLESVHNVKLLTLAPVTVQAFYCREDIGGLAGLEGKKVRVFNKTMADFVEAVGGATVNIPFAEVVPAMQRGVADCAITGTASGNTARWWEVTSYLYVLPMGWAMTFFGANLDSWNRLDESVRDYLTAELAVLEDKMWAQADGDVQDGIDCNTGMDVCDSGIEADPKMKLIEVSDADRALHAELMQSTVVPRWAERCGEECAMEWNDTIGKVLGIMAPAN